MNDNIILYASILNGYDGFEVSLQYRLIQKLIPLLGSGEIIDMDEFSAVLDDVEEQVPISDRQALELILKTKCFLWEDDELKYADSLVIGGIEITPKILEGLFCNKKEGNGAGEGNCVEKKATINGLRWCMDMVQLAMDVKMDGLPAFMRCGDEDSLIGSNVAGTATSDALSLLCSCLDDIRESGIESHTVAKAFEFLVKQVLSCQCNMEGWDEGGFYPLEDQPEAEHPTVDATCLAVMALCDFYSNCGKLEDMLSIHINVRKQEISDAVLLGLGFLFRMRQPEGSYGIYKYMDEYLDNGVKNDNSLTGEASPHENCTRMVLSTMGVCKGSGLFDECGRYELYGKCSDVIESAYGYLVSHQARSKHALVWAPYFGSDADNYSAADIIVSTARVCRSFIPVWWQMGDERESIKQYYRGFLTFWNENQEDISGKTGRYTFKTPGENHYSEGIYSWQGYAEMIAAFTALQGYNLFGMSFTKDEWKLIDRAATNTMNLQHKHGHWNAPHTSNPFCAATLAALEMLREYRSAKGLA